jgi:hypothetical protein
LFPKKSWEQLAQLKHRGYLILIVMVNTSSFIYLTVRLVTTEPTALVFAPPAVKVTTPAEVIVPARVPATPPDIVKTSP